MTVSEDACVMIWRICDKDGRGIKQEHEAVYAQEILVTKTDLEEKAFYVLILFLLIIKKWITKTIFHDIF